MQNKDNLTVDNVLTLCYIIGVMSLEKEEQKMKVDFRKQFDDVVQWAKKHKITVTVDQNEEDRYEPSEKTIFINSRSGPEMRYYTILHECGHVLVEKGWKSFDREHPMYATSSDKRICKSKAYRVSIVAEEIEAWKRGRRLAKRLNHKIDDSKYDKCITDNVMTYIEAAATGEEL